MITATIICSKCQNRIELDQSLLNSDLQLLADALSRDKQKLQDAIDAICEIGRRGGDMDSRLIDMRSVAVRHESKRTRSTT